MSLGVMKIGKLTVGRMMIGGNPFCGYSHQGTQRDQEMSQFYTPQCIKQTLRDAEELGITAHLGRADRHVMQYMKEYWDEGGQLRWLGQSAPEIDDLQQAVGLAIQGGARACHIHGGVMDFAFANNQLDAIGPAIEKLRKAGLAAGIAAHNPKVIEWAEKNLDVDYYMCSYYNAAHRDQHAGHVSGMKEWFRDEDRQIMAQLIQTLSKPVIHYKVLAAGRNKPEEAMDFLAKHLRSQDGTCIGIYTKEFPDGMAQNIRLLEAGLRKYGKLPATKADGLAPGAAPPA